MNTVSENKLWAWKHVQKPAKKEAFARFIPVTLGSQEGESTENVD